MIKRSNRQGETTCVSNRQDGCHVPVSVLRHTSLASPNVSSLTSVIRGVVRACVRLLFIGTGQLKYRKLSVFHRPDVACILETGKHTELRYQLKTASNVRICYKILIKIDHSKVNNKQKDSVNLELKRIR